LWSIPGESLISEVVAKVAAAHPKVGSGARSDSDWWAHLEGGLGWSEESGCHMWLIPELGASARTGLVLRLTSAGGARVPLMGAACRGTHAVPNATGATHPLSRTPTRPRPQVAIGSYPNTSEATEEDWKVRLAVRARSADKLGEAVAALRQEIPHLLEAEPQPARSG